MHYALLPLDSPSFLVLLGIWNFPTFNPRKFPYFDPTRQISHQFRWNIKEMGCQSCLPFLLLSASLAAVEFQVADLNDDIRPVSRPYNLTHLSGVVSLLAVKHLQSSPH